MIYLLSVFSKHLNQVAIDIRHITNIIRNILSSTDWLFRCITILQCGLDPWMLQAKIQTRQSDIFYQSCHQSQRKWRKFLHISFWICVIGCRSLQFLSRALHFSLCGNRPILHSNAQPTGWAYILLTTDWLFHYITLFGVARTAKYFKPRSKADWRKVNWISYPKPSSIST